jgi:hypothetical protein
MDECGNSGKALTLCHEEFRINFVKIINIVTIILFSNVELQWVAHFHKKRDGTKFIYIKNQQDPGLIMQTFNIICITNKDGTVAAK